MSAMYVLYTTPAQCLMWCVLSSSDCSLLAGLLNTVDGHHADLLQVIESGSLFTRGNVCDALNGGY